MKISILLTCVGSQVSPSVIQTIRHHPRYEIKVVGIDNKNKEESVGAHFSDTFYQVPMGDDREYVHVIQDIVKEEKVKVILPGSDEEALALSEQEERFLNIGCAVACSHYEVTELAIDKCRTMRRLKEQRIPVADFYEIDSINDLIHCAKKLRFPLKPFVIKPKISRGGRGFRVVKETTDSYEAFLNADSTTIDFGTLERIFRAVPHKIRDFLVMDYLPGKKYSTDILTKDGQMQCVVIRNKIFPVGSPTQVADIVFDDDLIDYALSVMNVLRFNYFVQFEIGRDEKGEAKLIEINPRLDATLPICMGIGINFYHEIINHAMNNEYSENVRILKDYRLKKRFMRYWQHCFI